MTCGERICLSRKEKGLTQNELAQMLNLNYSTISKYESDSISIPSEILKNIANILDVSTDYLLGNVNISNAKKDLEKLCMKLRPSQTEYNIIFNSLINDKTINLNLLNSNNGKIKKVYTEILKIYGDYFENDKEKNIDKIDSRFIDMLKTINKEKILSDDICNVFPIPEDIKRVPVIGKISAGLPILAVENIIDYAFAPSSKIKEGFDYFYLVVQGDSMNRKFNNGDLILIQKQDYLNEKEIGVFLVDNQEATVKQFREQKGNIMILDPMSTNPIHIAQMYDIKQTPVLIIGKVISYQGDV